MLDKARTLEADEIVIDLEDSVRAEAKEEARAAACAALGADWGTRAVAVRVNGIDTRWWTADLTALAAANRGALESVVIPKCEAAAHLEAAARLLHEQERRSDTAGPPVALQALIETATGLVRIGEITAADPRLETLIIGYADLRASLGRPPGADYPGDPWLWVRETVLVNARAAGLAAIDGPSLDVSDEGGLRASAASARALGFDGKWAIHPSQIRADQRDLLSNPRGVRARPERGGRSRCRGGEGRRAARRRDDRRGQPKAGRAPGRPGRSRRAGLLGTEGRDDEHSASHGSRCCAPARWSRIAVVYCGVCHEKHRMPRIEATKGRPHRAPRPHP